MTLSWDAEQFSLDDQSRFETLNGLWSGKKPPFVTAGVIRNTNFTESGRVDYSDVAWLQVEQKQLAKRQLKPGDIIVERSGGGPKQPVGRVVYFDREDLSFSFSNFTSAIRVRDCEAFDSKFVFYGLLELYQSGRTEDIQRHTTGIRNLDFTAYKERATFPQIPLPEQRQIAGVLGVVQRAIEQQERLLQLTAELKKTLLHQLFTHGLRGEPQKQTEIGPVPQSWKVVTLGELVEDAPQVNMRSEGEREIQYIDVSSISREFLRVDSTAGYVLKDAPGRARKKVKTGDVIFATVRPTLLRVARITPEHDEQVCSTAFCVLRDKNKRAIGRFIYYLAQREQFVKQLAAIESGVSYPAVTDRQVKAQLVPVPHEEEQIEIATILEACDAKIRMHASKKQSLTDLFRTLLHQLMTAQIRAINLNLRELPEGI